MQIQENINLLWQTQSNIFNVMNKYDWLSSISSYIYVFVSLLKYRFILHLVILFYHLWYVQTYTLIEPNKSWG